MSFRHSRRKIKAFTLAEVMIAGALLVVLISGAVMALTQMNRAATAARLRTIALAVAQQRIDVIMTTPWQILGTRPTLLTAGTVTENNLPLNNDDYNAATSLITPYTTLDSQVLSTRTTVITDLTTRTIRAVVTVSFTYRNRPYNITLNTLRTTDSI
jgi:type II secretory pathway pseudopilin PulG